MTYRLDAAADVTFVVARKATGRRSGRACAKPTRRNRARRRCMRLVPLRDAFTRPSTLGANAFRFTGRVGGRKLAPGSYDLLGTPRAGGAVRATFRVIR